MKSKIMLKLVRLWAVILLISFSFAVAEDTTGEFRPVDPNRIPEILTLISEQVRSNYDSIKTWQGEVEATTVFVYEGAEAERIFRERTNGMGEIPKAVKNYAEFRYQFAIDVEKDFLYSKLYRENPQAYMALESGRNLGTKSTPRQAVSIITQEYQVDCTGGHTLRDGRVVSCSAIKQARPKGSTCASNTHPVFDPRKTLTIGGPVWESFPRTLQYINEHGKYSFGGYDLKIEESISENVTKYRIVKPNKAISGNYLFLTKIFSSEVGFNMTSYEVINEDGKILYEWKWDYDLIDGVHLPKVTSQRNFTREGGKLDYEERYTFKNQKVNKPIPEETFTYKNLGLKEGDKFIDKIAGKEFSYQNGKLIELAKESPKKQSPIPDSNEPNQSP